MRPRWMYVAASLLSLAVLASLLSTADGLGFARDEGFYYRASLDYQGWFDELFQDPSAALTRRSVDRHWEYNHEHPALMKTLFGFSWRIFSQNLDWLRPSTALRAPGMAMAALCVFIVVIWGWRLGGPVAGVSAGVLLAAQPRFFYHAHLACFDVPVTAMWIATVYAYWRAQRSSRWAVASGVLFGLCLCTKLNAFFIPPLLIVHHLAMLWWERRQGERARPLVPRSLAWMAILGPIIFFLHWPWIWFDTAARVGFYMGFHGAHPHYNMEYFGTTIFGPPTPVSFPFVMTLLTLPATTTLLGVIGLWTRLRRKRPEKDEDGEPHQVRLGTDLLVILSVLWPMAIIAWPTVPIFGGTKHWLPAMPFVAILAGVGVQRATDAIGELSNHRVVRGVASSLVLALLLAPGLRETASSHPFGLTHYNVLIGGVPGAADAGLNRGFWGYTTGSLIDWLNEHVEPRGVVFFHDTAHDAFRMYRDDGVLRRDIRWGSTENADFGLVHHEQHMAHVEYEIWERFGVTVPVKVVTHQGVPVVSVFQRLAPSDRHRP